MCVFPKIADTACEMTQIHRYGWRGKHVHYILINIVLFLPINVLFDDIYDLMSSECNSVYLFQNANTKLPLAIPKVFVKLKGASHRGTDKQKR